MIKHELDGYVEYKDSGIDWVGKVPKHWNIVRIKEMSLINEKSLSQETSDDYSFDYVDISGVTYGTEGFIKERITFKEAPSRARRIVRKGDTIISTVRTYLKAVTSINQEVFDLIVSTGFAVLSPKKNINPDYCSYLFKSEFIINEIAALSKGVSYPAINASVIGNLFFITPTIVEQTAIAKYLSRKTAQIDRKIDLLTQKAAKYTNFKESLISETVTKGLDKTASVRASGVEWIGEVPEHWFIKRGKDIFKQTKNKAGSDSSSYDVLSLTLKGVIKRDLDNMKGKIPESFDGYQITNINNLVLCLFDMDVTPRIVGYVNQKGIITSAYTVLVGKYELDMKYYFYYFLEQNRNKSLLANSKTLRSTMTFDLFSQLQLPVPTIVEQQNIAEYLDTKTVQIDLIIESINTQIDKLKELRKTLINDVVTGKIKVTSIGDEEAI